jgi:hypothetical protein
MRARPVGDHPSHTFGQRQRLLAIRAQGNIVQRDRDLVAQDAEVLFTACFGIALKARRG